MHIRATDVKYAGVHATLVLVEAFELRDPVSEAPRNSAIPARVDCQRG